MPLAPALAPGPVPAGCLPHARSVALQLMRQRGNQALGLSLAPLSPALLLVQTSPPHSQPPPLPLPQLLH